MAPPRVDASDCATGQEPSRSPPPRLDWHSSRDLMNSHSKHCRKIRQRVARCRDHDLLGRLKAENIDLQQVVKDLTDVDNAEHAELQRRRCAIASSKGRLTQLEGDVRCLAAFIANSWCGGDLLSEVVKDILAKYGFQRSCFNVEASEFISGVQAHDIVEVGGEDCDPEQLLPFDVELPPFPNFKEVNECPVDGNIGVSRSNCRNLEALSGSPSSQDCEAAINDTDGLDMASFIKTLEGGSVFMLKRDLAAIYSQDCGELEVATFLQTRFAEVEMSIPHFSDDELHMCLDMAEKHGFSDVVSAVDRAGETKNSIASTRSCGQQVDDLGDDLGLVTLQQSEDWIAHAIAVCDQKAEVRLNMVEEMYASRLQQVKTEHVAELQLLRQRIASLERSIDEMQNEVV